MNVIAIIAIISKLLPVRSEFDGCGDLMGQAINLTNANYPMNQPYAFVTWREI